MASGPLLAGLISLFPITFTLAASFLDQHQVVIAEVNPLTSPGWVMAFLWIVFGVVVIVYFDEPSKEAASYNIREADAEAAEPDATTGSFGACKRPHFALIHLFTFPLFDARFV